MFLANRVGGVLNLMVGFEKTPWGVNFCRGFPDSNRRHRLVLVRL